MVDERADGLAANLGLTVTTACVALWATYYVLRFYLWIGTAVLAALGLW